MKELAVEMQRTVNYTKTVSQEEKLHAVWTAA